MSRHVTTSTLRFSTTLQTTTFPAFWKKDHLDTFPWLIRSKIKNKCIGICFLLYSIIVIVIVSTLSFLCCVASSTLIYKNNDNPQCSNLHSNQKDNLSILQWLIVSKIENKSLQIHTLLFASSFLLGSIAYCGDVPLVHFLILDKAIKYTWMALSLLFSRWIIHKRLYSWSNRSFPHL